MCEIKNKVKDKISNCLKKVFKQPVKQTIREYQNRLNFACPFCLDSNSNLNAKRGNIYFNYNKYKCFNSGCDSSNLKIVDFLRKIGELNSFDIDEIEKLHEITEETKKPKIRNSVSSLSEILIPENIFIEKFKVYKVEPNNYIYKFLKDRKLELYFDNFLMDFKYDRIFILNKNKKGIIGFQIRNLNPLKTKYESYNYSNMCKLLGMENKIKEIYRNSIDEISLKFNILKVDVNEMITIFEGPIDSFFIDNAVSSCGIDRLSVFNDLNFKRFWLDNDLTGLNKAKELLSKGESVFLWSKYFKELNISPKEKIKDVNDLVKKEKLDLEIAENCFSDSEFDLYYL